MVDFLQNPCWLTGKGSGSCLFISWVGVTRCTFWLGAESCCNRPQAATMLHHAPQIWDPKVLRILIIIDLGLKMDSLEDAWLFGVSSDPFDQTVLTLIVRMCTDSSASGSGHGLRNFLFLRYLRPPASIVYDLRLRFSMIFAVEFQRDDFGSWT